MKPTLRTQKTGYDCGPVAVYNAHVLAGLKPMSLSKLKKILETDKDGTDEMLMSYYIAFRSRSGRELYGLPLQIALSMLSNKDILILGYELETMGHYVAIAMKNGKLRAYNWAPDHVVEKKSFKKLKKSAIISEKWLEEKLNSEGVETYTIVRDNAW